MTTPSYFLKKKKILNLYVNANMYVPSKIVRNFIIVLFTCTMYIHVLPMKSDILEFHLTHFKSLNSI